MEIQSTLTSAKDLKKGDFVTDVTPHLKGALLGMVVKNEGNELSISLYNNNHSPYFTEGKVSRFGRGETSWDVLSKQEALKFIAKQNPDGFTVDKNTLEPITEGWAVAVSETQNSFGEEGLKQVIEHAEQKSYIEAIGGWLNSEDGQYYFDAVMVVQDYETAAELGYRNKQKAIFDLYTGEEFKLK